MYYNLTNYTNNLIKLFTKMVFIKITIIYFVQVPSEKLECFLIFIALLVMAVLSYALYCNMQDNWQFDPELRYHVFFVAFLMLLLSIVICYYIRYRLSYQVAGYHTSQQVIQVFNLKIQMVSYWFVNLFAEQKEKLTLFSSQERTTSNRSQSWLCWQSSALLKCMVEIIHQVSCLVIWYDIQLTFW